MPLVTLIAASDGAEHVPQTLFQARAWLDSLGAEAGRLATPREAQGLLPRLAHARELLALERRFGATLMVRTRRADLALEADEHVHGEAEQLVVLEGTTTLVLRAARLGGWLRVQLRELEWLSLPAGLPHRRLDSGPEPLALRLLASRAGLQLRPALPLAPLTLAAWPAVPRQIRPVQQQMRNRSLGVQAPLPRVAA